MYTPAYVNVKTLWIAAFLALGVPSCREAGNKKESVSNLSPAMRQDYLQLGESMASLAQKELLSTVTRAIEEKGIIEAIHHCNMNALRITDSTAQANNVFIRRISTKYRNEADKPANNLDESVLYTMENSKEEGKIPEPQLFEQGNEILYYKPIVIGMPTCLQCHGKPESDIKPEVWSEIKKHYPNDLAHGYSLGDLRGAWKIVFTR